jgi:hypothetical protein
VNTCCILETLFRDGCHRCYSTQGRSCPWCSSLTQLDCPGPLLRSHAMLLAWVCWPGSTANKALSCLEPAAVFHHDAPTLPLLQVAWSPVSPGTFLTCQAGRAVRVANFAGVACSVETSADPATGQDVSHLVSRPLRVAPTWMRRKCCARFGWGGKLATIKPSLGKDSARIAVVSVVAVEPQLKVHSQRFEQAMEGDLSSYCRRKVLEETDAEADYWNFIQVCPCMVCISLAWFQSHVLVFHLICLPCVCFARLVGSQNFIVSQHRRLATSTGLGRLCVTAPNELLHSSGLSACQISLCAPVGRLSQPCDTCSEHRQPPTTPTPPLHRCSSRAKAARRRC